MSEQELMKWVNKFHLWKTLHPEYMFQHAPSEGLCTLCAFCERNEEKKNCMDIPTVQYNRGTKKAGVREIGVRYSSIDYLCIEWVKNV